jgi:hypothetical protein
MRSGLASRAGARKKFRAHFSKIGKKVNYKGYSEETLLLTNVTDADTNEPVADHVWFTYSKAFEKVMAHAGSWITFEARVKEYTKGYVNRSMGLNKKRKDLKLSHPTNVMISYTSGIY